MMVDQGSVSVTEAATKLGINPSTAYRTLDTLAADGFAKQTDNRRYSPGPQLLKAGQTAGSLSIRARVRPYLEELFTLTNETVHLASLVGVSVAHHDCIEARDHTLVFTNRLQKRVPAHLTSEGKSMLAELSTPEVDARFEYAFSTSTSSDAPDMGLLHRQLDDARKRGYATNFEESEKGIAAMAISLGKVDGELISLSVALPIARYSEDAGKLISNALLQVRTEARAALSPGTAD